MSILRSGCRWSLVCASLFVCWPDAAAFAQAADNQAAAFTAFAEKIGRYERLRARLEERLPTLEGQRRSWSVMLMRRYLASAVRTARPRAQIGDVFTPPIAAVFRHALVDAVYDVDIEGLVPDESDVVVDLVVNEPVPEWALDRLPMPLLDRLPALPEGIEYRVVSGSLVLWDVHAEILIDTLPNAFVTTDPEDGEQR